MRNLSNILHCRQGINALLLMFGFVLGLYVYKFSFVVLVDTKYTNCKVTGYATTVTYTKNGRSRFVIKTGNITCDDMFDLQDKSDLELEVSLNDFFYQIELGHYYSVTGNVFFSGKSRRYYLSSYTINKMEYLPENNLQIRVEKLKGDIKDTIESQILNPFLSIILGVSLGVRLSIPDKLYELFINTGTIHVISVSGYNLNVISRLLDGLLGRAVNIYLTRILGIVFILLYGYLVGFNPPVLRAVICYIYSSIAVLFGYGINSNMSLWFAFSVMLIFVPINLLNVSFWLSFLSMVGVLYVDKVITRFVPKLLDTSCISSFVSTGPYVSYKFGRVSLISIPINIVISPLINIITIVSFIMVVFYKIDFILEMCTFIIYPFTKLFFGILMVFNDLSSSLEFKLSTFTFVSVYLLLVNFFLIFHEETGV